MIQNLTPPIARKIPHTFQHHSHTFVDEYAWLQDKSDPEVIAYLEAENAYARAALVPTEALQETLFQELRGRIQENDASVPAQHGEYYYYRRIQAGKPLARLLPPRLGYGHVQRGGQRVIEQQVPLQREVGAMFPLAARGVVAVPRRRRLQPAAAPAVAGGRRHPRPAVRARPRESPGPRGTPLRTRPC